MLTLTYYTLWWLENHYCGNKQLIQRNHGDQFKKNLQKHLALCLSHITYHYAKITPLNKQLLRGPHWVVKNAELKRYDLSPIESVPLGNRCLHLIIQYLVQSVPLLKKSVLEQTSYDLQKVYYFYCMSRNEFKGYGSLKNSKQHIDHS